MAPDKAKSSKGNLLETLTDQGNVDLPDKPSGPGEGWTSQTTQVQAETIDSEKAKGRVFGGSRTGPTRLVKNVNSLDHAELDELIRNAPLGRGLNVAKIERLATGNVVISTLPSIHDIDALPLDFCLNTQELSYSSHASSYTSAGWEEGGIEVLSPWVSASFGGSSAKSTETTSAGSQLYITGRWSYTMCRLTLPRKLKPHPDFQLEIHQALKDEPKGSAKTKLQDIFNRWGFFFVGGVEMGGAQYVTAERTTVDEATTTKWKKEMHGAIGARFKLVTASLSAGGGKEGGESQAQHNEFENEIFLSVGGQANAASVDDWVASLSDFSLWRALRPTEVRSVYELLDDSVVEKIKTFAPVPPAPKQA